VDNIEEINVADNERVPYRESVHLVEGCTERSFNEEEKMSFK
jgi:hypothetical protein